MKVVKTGNSFSLFAKTMFSVNDDEKAATMLINVESTINNYHPVWSKHFSIKELQNSKVTVISATQKSNFSKIFSLETFKAGIMF